MSGAQDQKSKPKVNLTDGLSTSNVNSQNNIFKGISYPPFTIFYGNDSQISSLNFGSNQTFQTSLWGNQSVQSMSNSLISNNLQQQKFSKNNTNIHLNVAKSGTLKNSKSQKCVNSISQSLIITHKYLFKPLNNDQKIWGDNKKGKMGYKKINVMNIALQEIYLGLSKEQIRIKRIYQSNQSNQPNQPNHPQLNHSIQLNKPLKPNSSQEQITILQANNLIKSNNLQPTDSLEKDVPSKPSLPEHASITSAFNHQNINSLQTNVNKHEKQSDLQFHKKLNSYLLTKVSQLQIANQNLTKKLKNYQLQKPSKQSNIYTNYYITEIQRLKKQLNQVNQKNNPTNKNNGLSFFQPKTAIKQPNAQLKQTIQNSNLLGQAFLTKSSSSSQHINSQLPNQSFFNNFSQYQSIVSSSKTANIVNKSQVHKKFQNLLDKQKIKRLFSNQNVQKQKLINKQCQKPNVQQMKISQKKPEIKPINALFQNNNVPIKCIPKATSINSSNYSSYNQIIYPYSGQNNKNHKLNDSNNSYSQNVSLYGYKNSQSFKIEPLKSSAVAINEKSILQKKKQFDSNILSSNDFNPDYMSKIAAGQLKYQNHDNQSQKSFVYLSGQQDNSNQQY